jgi:hypothetical protein
MLRVVESFDEFLKVRVVLQDFATAKEYCAELPDLQAHNDRASFRRCPCRTRAPQQRRIIT